MPSLRTDAPLVRHLSKTYGFTVGRLWQDLPLFQVTEEMRPTIMRATEGQMPTRRRPASVPTALNLGALPFDDLLFDFGPLLENMDGPGDLLVWCRLCSGRMFQRTLRTMCPWWTDHRPFANLEPDNLVCTGWFYDSARQHCGAMPLCVTIACGAERTMTSDTLITLLFDAEGKEHYYNAEDRTLHQDAIQELAPIIWYTLRTGHYLGQCPEYLVEECPTRYTTRPPAKKDKKPWAFCYLPRLILLDPHKAPSLRMGQSTGQGGTHASPRPHQRRGHWRTFRDPMRFGSHVGERIFVKPAWIGPREWMQHGNVYRVIGR